MTNKLTNKRRKKENPSAQGTPLGLNFVAGDHTVLCGRGSICSRSPGNVRLRTLVEDHLKLYANASNRADKSEVVSLIIDTMRKQKKLARPDADTGGVFVKFEKGQWWEVNEAFIREKIGGMFRDRLHTKYRSSSKAKLARRRQHRQLKKAEERKEGHATSGEEDEMSSSQSSRATLSSTYSICDTNEADCDASWSSMLPEDLEWLPSCFPNGENIPAASNLASAELFEDVPPLSIVNSTMRYEPQPQPCGSSMYQRIYQGTFALTPIM
jgi:hypothetical protein